MNEIEQKKHAINKAMRITSFMVDILKKPAHEKNPPDYEFEAIVEISRLLYLDRAHQLIKNDPKRTIQKILFDRIDKYWETLRLEAVQQIKQGLSARIESLNAEELSTVEEIEDELYGELKNFLFDTIGKLKLEDITKISLKTLKPNRSLFHAEEYKNLLEKLHEMEKKQFSNTQVYKALRRYYPGIMQDSLKETVDAHVKDDNQFEDTYLLAREIIALDKGTNIEDIKRSNTRARKMLDRCTDALPPEEKKELLGRITVKAPKVKPV